MTNGLVGDQDASQAAPSLHTLRREFVSMLFALAAAQVAVTAYDVVEAEPSSAIAPWWERIAAISHLVLALFVIVTSWIGWSKSKSAGRGVSGVFDRDFPALLLDVLLVIVYFCLVSSAEVQTNSVGKPQLEAPSIVPDLVWTCAFLLLYLLWDAASKWLPREDRPRHPDGWLKNAIATSTSSALSLGTAVAVTVCAWFVLSPVDAVDALLIDLSLIAIVILFRVLKSAEVEWFETHRQWRAPTGVLLESHWASKARVLTSIAVGSCAIAVVRQYW